MMVTPHPISHLNTPLSLQQKFSLDPPHRFQAWQAAATSTNSVYNLDSGDANTVSVAQGSTFKEHFPALFSFPNQLVLTELSALHRCRLQATLPRATFGKPRFQTRPLYSGKPWFLAPSVRYYQLLDRFS